MRTRYRDSIIQAMVVILTLTLLALGLKYTNAQEHQATVIRADYVTETSGSTVNGGLTSTTRYLVCTSDGEMYEIGMRGIGARPGLIGRISEGEHIRFITRGYRMEVLGIYPWIDKIL